MIAKIIIVVFIFFIIACVAKKHYGGAGLTLLIGFVVVALWNDQSYWDMNGKTLMNLGMSLMTTFIDGFKNGL